MKSKKAGEIIEYGTRASGDGCIELIDYDNAAEWRGDLERKPSLYQWRPINE